MTTDFIEPIASTPFASRTCETPPRREPTSEIASFRHAHSPPRPGHDLRDIGSNRTDA